MFFDEEEFGSEMPIEDVQLPEYENNRYDFGEFVPVEQGDRE